jgi:mercuric ion binding protein
MAGISSGWTAAWLLALGAGALAQQQAHLTLRIEGMSCEPCASAVESQLGEAEGVTGYQVSYERAEARLSYDPARTTPEKIIRTLGVTGFRFSIVPPDCPGDACRTQPRGASDASAAELIVLGDSQAALVTAFNASRGKPRFLAILSPTCGLCLHGADSVRAALLDEHADARLELLVVWAPMLPGDDLAAARASSALVRHARVRQFYDPGRRVGSAFRAEVFPEAVARMRASLPPGHFLTRPFATRDPAQPEWDIYLFFGPDSEWAATAPPPRRFVRQVELREGRSSVLWKDDYAKAPIEASLEVELRRVAFELLGRP